MTAGSAAITAATAGTTAGRCFFEDAAQCQNCQSH
nr:MAG TPA: hypothetical protein [Caudoviricetes sp.]